MEWYVLAFEKLSRQLIARDRVDGQSMGRLI